MSNRKITEFISAKAKNDQETPQTRHIKNEPEKNFSIFLPPLAKSVPKNAKNVKMETEKHFEIILPVKVKENPKRIQPDHSIKCKLCGKKFQKGSSIQKHPCQLKCEICHKSYSAFGHLRRHQIEMHAKEIDALKCHVCEQMFVDVKYLDSHIKLKHVKFQPFECDFCGKMFEQKYALVKHIIIHTGQTKKCKICNKELKIDSLRKHVKLHIKSERMFKCQICESSFKTIKSLKMHGITHDKKFTCDKCDKKFPTKGHLRTHQKYFHENPNSFSCKICEKSFNRKTILTAHQRKHEKNRVKRFSCDECDYKTDLLKSLENHKRQHRRTEAKVAAMKNPVKCEKCNEFFKDAKALSYHNRFVHPKELSQCDICGACVKSKYYIRHHVKIHLKNK